MIEGEIQLAEVVFRRRRTLLVRLADGTGFVTLRFFHFSGSQQAQLARGQRLRCFGEVRMGPAGPGDRASGVPPCRSEPTEEAASRTRLTPIYPATEGVQQGRLRVLTDLALDLLSQGADASTTCRPACSMRSSCRRSRPHCATSIVPARCGRRRSSRQACHPAQRRLAFEELLAHQLSLRLLRQATDS